MTQCGCAVSIICYLKVVASRSAFLQGSRAANQDEVCVTILGLAFCIITQVSSGSGLERKAKTSDIHVHLCGITTPYSTIYVVNRLQT